MEKTQNSPGPPGLRSVQERKAAFGTPNNNPSPGLTPKKPAVPKPALGLKPTLNEVKPPFGKPSGVINRVPGSISANNQGIETSLKPSAFKSNNQQKEEPTPPFQKPLAVKAFITASSSSQEPKFGVKPKFPPEPKEHQPAFPKPSQLKTNNSAAENEPKPPFEKKPPFAAKPPVNVGGLPSENIKRNLVTKTFSNSQENKPEKQTKELTEENLLSSSSSQTFGVALRSTGIKQIQSPFITNQKTEEPNDSSKVNSISNRFQTKTNQDSNSFPKKPSAGNLGQDILKEQKDSFEPKRKLIPSLAKLGPPPQKPARPPNVDIKRFTAANGNGGKAPICEKRSSALSSALPPPPPVVKTAVTAVPSLPPRNIKLPSEPTSLPEEENYDDVEIEGSRINDISEESDECYEGIGEHSAAYKKEEEEKNQKKRKKELEQAKIKQKEKEKKEQEMKKRFKLTDKVDVLHQAKASTDYKGGKNELSFRNGDQIEIIRVTDNPEGKWLGRMNGTYGYIKTAMVNIDYGSLPKQKGSTIPTKPVPDQEIYDDVGDQDSVSNASGNAVFPAPPTDEDIYDGVDDDPPESSVPQEEEKNSPWSWFKKRKGTQHIKKKNVHETTDQEDSEESEFSLSHSSVPESDVYDDVESEFPPPPLEVELKVRTNTLGKSADAKTLKKLEKEEKEFRKKFKFTGEIRVLSSVQVLPSLTTKKWGSKDLPLNPSETLDVIQLTNNSTILCKNSEGKYGYVLRSNVVENDGDIYDDIGEDCIYDND
ncbi:FYN-binding protein 1 [Gastrophryne carolinensis]